MLVPGFRYQGGRPPGESLLLFIMLMLCCRGPHLFAATAPRATTVATCLASLVKNPDRRYASRSADQSWRGEHQCGCAGAGAKTSPSRLTGLDIRETLSAGMR